MGLIQKFFIKRRIKASIKATFNNDALDLALLGLVEIYQSLSEQDRVTLWELDYSPYSLPDLSLDEVSHNTTTEYQNLYMSNPFEWITGSKQADMLDYFKNPVLLELGRLRELTWLRLWQRKLNHIPIEHRELIGGGLRRVLQRWAECL